MFVCAVCLACALQFFVLSRSCLCNLILHVMRAAVSTVKNMQIADKRAATGKLASSGQLLVLLDSTIEVELCVVLVVKEVVDSVGLVLGTVNGIELVWRKNL